MIRSTWQHLWRACAQHLYWCASQVSWENLRLALQNTWSVFPVGGAPHPQSVFSLRTLVRFKVAMAVESSALAGKETRTSERRLQADHRSDDGFLHLHGEKSDE